MDSLTAKEIVKRFDAIRGERSNWEGYWEKVAKYCLPEKAFVTSTPSEGEELPVEVYDTTAMQSVGFLAAGLTGHLTSPAQKWFSLTTPNKDLMLSEKVKFYLRDAEDKIYNALNTSNFNHQIHEAYQDLVVFGTCSLYEEEDPNEIVRFDARHIREIFIVENATGRVEYIFRFFTLTAEQAKNHYGDKAGTEALKKFANKEYDAPIDYLHCVGPRRVRDIGKKDAANMPFFSKVIAYKDQEFVSQGGYTELPFFVPRWEKSSYNRYGYSPAMKAYGDIKSANEIKYDILAAGGKVVDPPIDAPHEGYLMPLDMRKGGINYRNIIDPNERIQMLNIQPNIPVGLEILNQERDNIKQAFFVDLFLLMERANMTATEVVQRTEEKMLLLGPVLGRLQNELLDPIIQRTFAILRRRGIIGDPPEELLENPDYEIKYEGKLAKMQRFSEAKATIDFLNLAMVFAKSKPEAMDWINDEEIIRTSQEVYGVNPKYLRTKEDVAAIREQRAKQQEAEMKMLAVKEGAGAARNIGAASKDLATADQTGVA